MSHPSSNTQAMDKDLTIRPKSMAFVSSDPTFRTRSYNRGSATERESEKLTRKERINSFPNKTSASLQENPNDGALPAEGRGLQLEDKPRSALALGSISRLFSHREDPQATVPSPPRAEPSESYPRRTHGGPIDLEGYFQQPAEDSGIQKQVSRIQQSISTHVFNFYGDLNCPPPNEIFWKAVILDDDEVHLQKTFSDQESFRLAAIQRAIARSSFDKIALDGDPETTFLPKDIVSLLRMTPKHSSEKFEFAATAMFRRTAANMLRLEQRGESEMYTLFRRFRVKAVSERLHRRLSPLANPEYDEHDRRLQLEAIITQISQLGAFLLLQPVTYRFEWSSRLRTITTSSSSTSSDHARGKGRRDSRFMIFPAMLKTGDSGGRYLRKPEVFCKPEYLDDDDDDMSDDHRASVHRYQ